MTCIIFYEDQSQLNKILSHNQIDHFIKVHYYGKKIIAIKEVANGNEKKCGFVRLFLKSIDYHVLVCEYANGIPRLWAALFGLSLQSHIFGALDYCDFDFKACHRPKAIRKILNRLYADEYIIYGDYNPTRDLMDELVIHYKSKVILKKRIDLNKVIKDGFAPLPWAVYIAQPWAEIGNNDNEDIQKALYEAMASRLSSAYYCKHPRQTNVEMPSGDIINGWLSLENAINNNGPPLIAVSLSSSLIYELKEMDINAVQIASRANGQTIFPNLKKAIEIIHNEISSIC